MRTPSYYLLSFVLLVLLQTSLSQNIVDNTKCRQGGKNCGAPDSPFSEKYCCIDSDGYNQLLKCCNPYIGLTIGLSIGVPVVVLIIIGVVVLYCVCARYHNRKMARLARIHARNRRRAERNAAIQAPPQYTPTDPTKPSDSELPLYSERDPYAHLQAAPAHPMLTFSDLNPPPAAFPPPIAETTQQNIPSPEENATGQQGDTDATNQQAAVVVREDIPLLEEEQSN